MELSVTDTGTGIAAEELPRIFERFHRVQGARGRSHEGSGIGLALVRELVKLHGGSVHVESTPGQGSTFTVTLPLGSAHLPPGQLARPSARRPRASRPRAFFHEVAGWLDATPVKPGSAPGPRRPRGDVALRGTHPAGG